MMSPMEDLKNRVALVTGGSRGIGAGIAVALARAGADVAVNYRQRADAANTVCAEITALGRKALAVQADVSVAAEVKRMVADVETRLGPVDILVNNAGIAHPRKLEEIAEAEWDEVLTVNLKSVFLVTQAVVGGMRKRKWGRIINLSSVAAHDGRGCGGALCGFKSRNFRTDALVRSIICQGRHYVQCHRTRADRNRNGDEVI